MAPRSPRAADDPTAGAAPARPKRRARRALGAVFGLGLLPLTGLLVLNFRISVPFHEGSASEHFDGMLFSNEVPVPAFGLLEVLEWRATRDSGSWEGHVPESVEPELVERVRGDELRVTLVGHASLLLQTAGLNVLTDPVWSERVSPVSWAGPKRFVAPGIPFDELPPIDVVLVSHNHYDHLDLATLRRLAEEHAPAIYLPLGNSALLERHGIEGARDLDWWESAQLSDAVTLHCVPAQHFSGRSFADRMRALWGGFVLETPGGPLYFAGDTGDGPHFEQIRERFGSPRLAMLPIGAYLPAWFMSSVHISPREAVEAHGTLGAEHSLGMHFGSFELADDGPLQPVEDLDRARVELGVTREHFRTLVAGEAWTLTGR